jgi:hypothetical membrane protein
MFRKIILTLGVIFIVSFTAFIIVSLRRNISLRTEFWWLVGEAALAAITMVIMAIDVDRLGKKTEKASAA